MIAGRRGDPLKSALLFVGTMILITQFCVIIPLLGITGAQVAECNREVETLAEHRSGVCRDVDEKLRQMHALVQRVQDIPRRVQALKNLPAIWERAMRNVVRPGAYVAGFDCGEWANEE